MIRCAMMCAALSGFVCSGAGAEQVSIDEMLGVRVKGDASARSLLRGTLGQFEEAGDIPGCILGESFDTPEVIFEPPAGQQLVFGDGGSLPFGDPLTGIVDNAGAIASDGFAGPVGGPDPAGERGLVFQAQRGEPIDLGFAVRIASAAHDQYASSANRPVFVQMDFYKQDHATFALWRPVSISEGLQTASFILGGVSVGPDIIAPLVAARGDVRLNESVILLATPPSGVQDSGAFYLGAKDIPENGWITLGVLISPGSMSYWVRDRETFGDGAPDVCTPMRDSGPFAGTRMFSEFGFGLEEGWAQLYPGTMDDPSTNGAIEGFGPALVVDDGSLVPAESFLDSAGNRVGARWAAQSVDGWWLFTGSDATEKQFPGYVMRNWWTDNYCVRGGRRVEACPADFDGDGAVGSSDLAVLLAAWGQSGGVANLDGQGVVDDGDLALLLAAWGACE